MARVRAKQTILSTGGLKLADKGDQGVALRGHTPSEASNYGKVAVRFKGRNRPYWVAPEGLTFLDQELDPVAYVAVHVDVADISLPREQAALPVFGHNLRRIRGLRGLGQEELSGLLADLGVSATQTAISHWEQGEHAPRGSYVEACAQALEVPVFVLFLPAVDCDGVEAADAFLQQLLSVLCLEQSM